MAVHPDYRLRGPDPDGDYFIVELVDGEELFLDEAFDSEDAALAALAKRQHAAVAARSASE
ncbi:MAG: hypothetical protein ACK4PC_08910 [Sphingopyxis sp.]